MKYSKTLGSVALSALLLLGVSGCNSSSSSSDPVAEVGETPITPYTRVAVIAGGDWGTFEDNGTAIIVPGENDVHSVADKIARYVVNTDESTEPGLEVETDWVIAGANPEKGEEYGFSDLLPIPVPISATVTKKSRVIEFCNKAYASAAMSTGKFHGSALPCEVSVHSENGNVYVDMLDADAIFNIFFTDIKDDMNDTALAEFRAMALDVKRELREMIIAALGDENASVSGSANAIADVTQVYDELGPEFSEYKIDNDIAFRSPYIVYKYGIDGGGPFDANATDDLARAIIAVLGDDTDTAENRVPGLSIASAWRSGRPDPINIPTVKVVEACSPKYAKKATVLGNEYITALPCEFTVYLEDEETIAISFLNPNFMFGTMFEGAVANKFDPLTDKDTIIEYSILADVVFADLRMIVDAAVQDKYQNQGSSHNLDLVIK